MNVNDSVLVRLTAAGKQRVGDRASPVQLTSDLAILGKGEWYCCQLWDLMRTFGDMMGPGRDTPFIDNVIWTIERLPDLRYIRPPGDPTPP